MSLQKTEGQVVESEDIFTTQDLLATTDVIEDVIKNTTEDKEPEDTAERVEDPSEDITDNVEDTEEAETDDPEMVTEDLEVDQEDPEEDVEEAVETDGGQSAAAKSAPKAIRISELPLSKVKHIIKLDPEVKLVNNEAVFLVTKAAELFIKSLAKESFNYAAQQRKKTITKSHVDQALTMLPVEL